jgi:hypothetical protein
MKFEASLDSVIAQEADKLIQRYHAYHNALHIEHARTKKRIANAPPKIIKTPAYWQLDKKYNPFYVRGHSKAIARSISKKLAKRSYVPHTPYLKK